MKILKKLKRPLAIILLGCIQIMGPTLSMEAVRSNLGEEDPANPRFNSAGNSTISAPFVGDDGMVYFRGTQQELFKVPADDGSGWVNVGGERTSSTPFYSGEYVFFQGTNNALQRVSVIPGKESGQLGFCWTKSPPFIYGGKAYSRGMKDELMSINWDASPGDYSSLKFLGNCQTLSQPYVGLFQGEVWVFHQGSDYRLYRVKSDGSNLTQIGGDDCYLTSAPFYSEADQYVYFQRDTSLCRIPASAGNNIPVEYPGNNTTLSTPFAYNGILYFRGSNDALYCIPTGSSIGKNVMLSENCLSSPFVYNGWVYFQGAGNQLSKVAAYNQSLWTVAFNFYFGLYAPLPSSETCDFQVTGTWNVGSNPPPSYNLPTIENTTIKVSQQGVALADAVLFTAGYAQMEPLGYNISWPTLTINFNGTFNGTIYNRSINISYEYHYKYCADNSRPIIINLLDNLYEGGPTLSDGPGYNPLNPQNQKCPISNKKDVYLIFNLHPSAK